MAWRSAAQTLRSWWSCVRIIQVGQPTAGRKRQSRDPSLPPNLAGMGSIARHRAVRKTQSRHVLPEGRQALSRVRPRPSDSLRVIPGGPEGPGRGFTALCSWVDSLPLRCARAGNDTALSALSRHHRPRAGDPDRLRRGACPHRDGRDEPGHDVSGSMGGERRSAGNVMFSLCS